MLPLPESVREALFQTCREVFPEEACGVVVGRTSAPLTWRFVAFDNLATRLHDSDPEAYPRDGRTAYAMNPLALQRLVEREEQDGGTLIAVCHSHPQHPSYFSATDRRAASPFGVPTYPRAWQVVVSVYDGVVRDIKAFGWREDDWHETPVEGARDLLGPPPGAHPLIDL